MNRSRIGALLFGMNDGNYQVFDAATFKVYTDGLADIIHGIKRALPQTRIYVMTPTVYDGTRHTPWSKNDAYNDVLDRYSEAAKQLAANEKLPVIDLHAVTTETLRAAKQQEPAYTFLPDGVHPEADGQLVMAAEILRVWGASPTGATVTIEAAKSTLAKLSIAAPMPWSVPLPSARLQSVRPEIKLLGGVNLRARGLAAGRYRVTVDGAAQEFTAAQLDAGVSLSDQSATARQASEKLAKMARERADLFFFRWRQVETKLDNANYQTLSDALARFDALLDEMTARERRAAQAFSYQVSIESLP